MKLKSTDFMIAILIGIIILLGVYFAYRGVIDTRAAMQAHIIQQDEIRIAKIRKQREELSKETLKWAHPSDINNAIQIREGKNNEKTN